MKPLKRKRALYTRHRRAKAMLHYFLVKYTPKCYFCGKKIDPDSFAGYRDPLTVHHIDENRKNNKPSNKTLTHRACHDSWHRKHPKEKK